VLNPDIVASVYIGGLGEHTFDLSVPATPVVLTLKKAYSETMPNGALKMVDIRPLVPYIPDEHKNIYDEILSWPVCNRNKDDN
jgi:hypothetical protein